MYLYLPLLRLIAGVVLYFTGTLRTYVKHDKHTCFGLVHQRRWQFCSQIFIAEFIKIATPGLGQDRSEYYSAIMGKKRKAGGRPVAQNKQKESERTKFDVEERFDDSEDEFQAGRDQILLEEAPEAKRRRRVAEEGSYGATCPNDFVLTRCLRRGIASTVG